LTQVNRAPKWRIPLFPDLSSNLSKGADIDLDLHVKGTQGKGWFRKVLELPHGIPFPLPWALDKDDHNSYCWNTFLKVLMEEKNSAVLRENTTS